jgi:ketosteroid isomerase-like protein
MLSALTRRGLAGATLAGIFAQAAAAGDGDALARFKAAIRAKYDMKERAFAAGDAEAIVNGFYTEDAVSAGDGEGTQVGRAEFLPLYKSVVGFNHIRVVSFATHVNGDAGWDFADFHVTPVDTKQAPFTFKMLFLWERRGGAWVCPGELYFKGSFTDHKPVGASR